MTTNTESDLESFRQQWRQEVSARKGTRTQPATRTSQPSQSGPGRPGQKKAGPPLASSDHHTSSTSHDHHDDPGHVYHDLPDAEQYLKLANEAERSKARGTTKEPRTALEHYEKAVEREGQGNLGDSVMLYRKAFKLDPRVNELYKNKHHPPVAAITKPIIPPSSDALTPSTTAPAPAPAQAEVRTSSIKELIEAFSQLSIPPAEPETDLSPPLPCPIASIPGEILSEVFLHLAIKDVSSFARLAQVCKRFAFLVMTSDNVWKRITLGSEIGFAAMHYRYACDVNGRPFSPPSPTLSDTLPLLLPPPPPPFCRDLTPTIYPTYRSQFRHRPRIRFNGCYISTVNYSRPGASNESRFTWINPVQIVTYYRYLRFFRDGTVISLLTTVEPANVVHHLTKENIHDHHRADSSLPTAVMKDALPGRWRLSGPLSESYATTFPATDSTKGPGEYTREPLPLDAITSVPIEEAEGDVLIETEGVRPKYMWKMQFAIGNAGRKEGSRNTRLNWKGFWSYNRLTDDWGEFGLKNDRGYVFSRVRSYNA